MAERQSNPAADPSRLARPVVFAIGLAVGVLGTLFLRSNDSAVRPKLESSAPLPPSVAPSASVPVEPQTIPPEKRRWFVYIKAGPAVVSPSGRATADVAAQKIEVRRQATRFSVNDRWTCNLHAVARGPKDLRFKSLGQKIDAETRALDAEMSEGLVDCRSTGNDVVRARVSCDNYRDVRHYWETLLGEDNATSNATPILVTCDPID